MTPEVEAVRSARDHAAWLELTPKPHATGGRERPGRISTAGKRSRRRRLFLGASCQGHASGVTARISVRRGRKPGEDRLSRVQGNPVKAVAIALANRMARVLRAPIGHSASCRATPA